MADEALPENADAVTVPGNEVLPDASSRVALRIMLPKRLYGSAPVPPVCEYCLTYIGSFPLSAVASSSQPASFTVAPPITLHASHAPAPYIPLVATG